MIRAARLMLLAAAAVLILVAEMQRWDGGPNGLQALSINNHMEGMTK